jgi:site-specific recombinase XerD
MRSCRSSPWSASIPSETVTKILQAIPTCNLRDRMLFTLLYEKGMQVGEALGLLATDVDLSTDDKKIRVFAGCYSRVFGTQLDIDITSC